MKNIILLFVFFIFFGVGFSADKPLYHNLTSNNSITISSVTSNSYFGSGQELTIDTTNFNNNLSSADNTIQKALDTIDNMNVGTGETNLNSTSEVEIKQVNSEGYIYSNYGYKIGNKTRVIFANSDQDNLLYEFNNGNKFWHIPIRRINKHIYPFNSNWTNTLSKDSGQSWAVSSDRISNVYNGTNNNPLNIWTNLYGNDTDEVVSGKFNNMFVTSYDNEAGLKYNLTLKDSFGNKKPVLYYNQFNNQNIPNNDLNLRYTLTGTINFQSGNATAWGLFRGTTSDVTDLANYGVGFYENDQSIYFVYNGQVNYIADYNYNTTYYWGIQTGGLKDSCYGQSDKVRLAIGTSEVDVFKFCRGTSITGATLTANTSSLAGITSDLIWWQTPTVGTPGTVTAYGRHENYATNSNATYQTGSINYIKNSEFIHCKNFWSEGLKWNNSSLLSTPTVGQYSATDISNILPNWNLSWKIGVRVQFPTDIKTSITLLNIDSNYNPYQ